MESPQNKTVYLGEEGSFTCIVDLAEFSAIFWYVTEDYILHYRLPSVYGAHTIVKDLPNNQLSSTLTISALDNRTNNSLVVCRGDLKNAKDIYREAYLIIQGLLLCIIIFELPDHITMVYM